MQGRKGDDLCNFRYRVGVDVIQQTIAVVVKLLHTFGLIKGELMSTDGQLEPSYSRYKGCAYACESCHQFAVDALRRQALREQLASGAKRLQITCPFPETVAKVREATAKKAFPDKQRSCYFDHDLRFSRKAYFWRCRR